MLVRNNHELHAIYWNGTSDHRDTLRRLHAALASATAHVAPPAADSQDGAGRLEIKTATGIQMVLIPAGEFQMGGGEEPDSATVHQVRVDAFYMDRCEVTQEVYLQLMGQNPARHNGLQNPVERVRWTDAIKFCNARSKAEGLTPCYDLASWKCDFAANGYRLPTEAEWEYACRAHSEGDFYFSDLPEQLGDYAWFKSNSRRKHQPVGQKRPNAFGLHDMAGNVREWCHDWYALDYYAHSPAENPPGPAAGDKAVLRGGAFSTTADSCTSWARYCDEPGFADACVASDDYGFRCVRRTPTGREEL